MIVKIKYFGHIFSEEEMKVGDNIDQVNSIFSIKDENVIKIRKLNF